MRPFIGINCSLPWTYDLPHTANFRITHFTHRSTAPFHSFHSAFLPHSTFLSSAFYQQPNSSRRRHWKKKSGAGQGVKPSTNRVTGFQTLTFVVIATIIAVISSPGHNDAKQEALTTVISQIQQQTAILHPFTELYAKDDRKETR